MASIDDVQNAIVDAVVPALYPNGTSNPSIANAPIYIAPGNFLKANVDAGLVSGNIFVEVFAQKGMTRNTTRVRDLFADPVKQVATIILDVANNTVTVNGTVTVGQVSMVIVNGVGFAYSAQAGDTLNIIASTLANMIPTASAINNIITITNANTLIARVSVPGSMRRILESKEGLFRVRIIASNESSRNLVSGVIELALANLTPRYYLPMSDGISASIRAKGIDEINTYELASAFVRDHIYLIEYHLVDVGQFQTIADTTLNSTVSNLPIS
jgi:hypothetical protein